MLKLLFVDDQLDDASSAASIAAKECEKLEDTYVDRADFGKAASKIVGFVPDLVILDLQEEHASGDTAFTGNETCEW